MFKRKARAPIDSSHSDEMRIYISPLMFVMAAYFVAVGMAYEYVCSLAAVLLHECAHAKIAKHYGYELNVIKLMPYGAALCGDVGMKPKHEAVVAIAGPALNLMFALLFAALWWLLPSSYMFTEAFCLCNLYIGLFNLLPVYPLDGGRVLFALLSVRMKRAKAYTVMRIISAVFGMVTLALFGVSVAFAPNICLLSVGAFMLLSAFIPDKRAQYTALFDNGARRERLKTPIEIVTFAVSADTELSALISCLNPDRFSEFVVLDNNLERTAAVSESELIAAVKAHGYTQKIGDISRNK